ncbi:MAG: vitamin B12 transporter, partial [Sphingobacteriales bacterium]
MVNRTIQVILLVLVVSSTSLVAQQDSAFLLKEIEVNSTVLESSAALSKISINSSTLDNQNHQKLTELISQNSLAFFKQYGYGNASTVSMRGLQDRHTKVLWNGLEINFLQLGSIDFNILPAAAFSKVSIQSGAMSALYGSGAIGGAILLESNLKNQKEGVSGAVQLSFGSFKSSHTSAAARIKGKKWSYGLSVFGGKSENNFPILGTIKTLEHAAQTNSGVIQNIGFKLNGKNSFKLSSWHQQSFREISPGFNPADTLADFTDENNRYVLTYKHLAKKFSISALAGYTFDVLHYKNRLINVDSRGTAQVFTQRAIFTYAFNEKLRIQAEGEARQEKATNVNYAQPETRQRYTTATKATYNPWSFY